MRLRTDPGLDKGECHVAPWSFLGADKRGRCYSTVSTCIRTVVGFGFGVFLFSYGLLVCFCWEEQCPRGPVLTIPSEPEERGSEGQEWAWPGSPPVLPDLLQLLPQPRGQGLPQPVQQLGQLHVVVSVVARQKRSRLGRGKNKPGSGLKETHPAGICALLPQRALTGGT